MVRFFYQLSTRNKIHFTGKNFFLFPGDFPVLSFGVCCVVFAALLYRYTLRQRVYRTLVALLLFFLSTMVVSYIRSTMALGAGRVLVLGFGAVPYDIIFVTSCLAVLAIFMIAALVRLLPAFSTAG